MGFLKFPLYTAIISLNKMNQLIFVMVKCGVLFEVLFGRVSDSRVNLLGSAVLEVSFSNFQDVCEKGPTFY
jgi:hypothetical protein